jgi:hypothetical protein
MAVGEHSGFSQSRRGTSLGTTAHTLGAETTDRRPALGVGTSILLIAVGAILRFAVSVTTSGFNVHTIGVILMIVGAVGLVISMFFWSSWGGFGGGGYHRQRRMTRDGAGGYVEDERTTF